MFRGHKSATISRAIVTRRINLRSPSSARAKMIWCQARERADTHQARSREPAEKTSTEEFTLSGLTPGEDHMPPPRAVTQKERFPFRHTLPGRTPRRKRITKNFSQDSLNWNNTSSQNFLTGERPSRHITDPCRARAMLRKRQDRTLSRLCETPNHRLRIVTRRTCTKRKGSIKSHGSHVVVSPGHGGK